jgi:hypothetical protein
MITGSSMRSSLITQFNKYISNKQVIGENSELSSVGTVKTAELAGNAGTSNLLENNFVNNNSQPSKYINSTLIGLQVKNDFGNKMQNLVETAKLQIASEDESNYAKRELVGEKAARATKELVSGEVADTESTRLEKERKESEKVTEKKLEEKTTENTPKGEDAGNNGNVTTPENSSGQRSVETATVQGEQVQAKSMVISQSATEVAVLKSDPAQQNADATISNSTSDGGVIPSINIVV